MPGLVSKSLRFGSRLGLPASKMGEKSRVCRNLFGAPDHESLRKDLDEQLAQANTRCAKKWNFDVESDMPLEGRYEWMTTDSSEYVPEFYTKGYSSRRTLTPVRNRCTSGELDSKQTRTPVHDVWSLPAASTPQTPSANERISQEEQEKTPEANKQTEERPARLVQRRISDYMPVRKRSREEDEETSATDRQIKARRLAL